MERIYIKNSDGSYLTNAAGLFLYRKLPDTYQELEYIANTSSAFINTGVAATNKLFKLDLQFTSDATRQLMGISGSSSAYWGNNKGTWEKVGNSQGVDTLARCVVNYDVGNITASRVTTWIEGSTAQYTGTDSNFAAASASPFRVFNLAGGSYNCIMKLFGLKVYNATGVLLNAFIPCKRLSDSVVGMYDLMTHTFVASSSSAVFTAGPVASALPAEYQEVNYISSNTTVGQLIDTDWIPSYTGGFKFEIQFQPTTASVRYGLLSNYSDGDKQLSIEINASNRLRLWLNNGSLDKTTSNSVSTSSVNTAVVAYTGSTYQVSLNGGTAVSGSYSVTGASTASLYMFLDRAKRTGTFTKPLRIYSCKIWQNGVLVRNYIPCYRISDSVIGMYDAVTNNFYINKGTGSFTKGTNV